MAKAKIIITWDKIHGLPQAKFKNVSTEDISDASIFLKGTTLKERHRTAICRSKKKRTNKLFRFIRRLFSELKFTRTERYFCKERVAPFPLTLTTMIVKPIRKRFINWLKNICGTGVIESNLTEIKSEFGEIKAMLQTHIEADTDKSELLKRLAEAEKAALRNSILQLCDICLKRESITSVEKLNLIDMYREYHNLGGDTYCTDRYEITLYLPEKN